MGGDGADIMCWLRAASVPRPTPLSTATSLHGLHNSTTNNQQPQWGQHLRVENVSHCWRCVGSFMSSAAPTTLEPPSVSLAARDRPPASISDERFARIGRHPSPSRHFSGYNIIMETSANHV